jgi:hypothetical protein
MTNRRPGGRSTSGRTGIGEVGEALGPTAGVLGLSRPCVRPSMRGYGFNMPTEDNNQPQPSSDDADPEKQSTPAGLTQDLEEEAEETGATTDPD